MKHCYVPSSSAALAVTLALLSQGVLAASPAAIEIDVSWTLGDGKTTTNYHSRVELIGLELAALAKQSPVRFIGKVGACTKRVTFRYPAGVSAEQSYYFTRNKLIVLAPKKQHSGSSYPFEASKFPELAQLLSEVGASARCPR
jgi:hypothetical protein